MAGVAVIVFAGDQFTKHLVETTLPSQRVVPVFGEFLQWYYVRNSGAAFSFASGMTWIFTVLAASVLVFIVWYAPRIRAVVWAVMFGLLLGGVLGNLSDRLFRPPAFGQGHVIDFISTPWMMPAIYNVADCAIVSSMALFMLLTLLGVGLDGKRAAKAAVGADQAPDAATEVGGASATDPVPDRD
ncbi:MAG TPA: signal peptidase II [Candidatus Lumbricidophila sp.]|nr:signal peptidase II [Candidatus Lumbricidophila sp.]